MKFSSIFPCDTREVAERFTEACKNLNIINLGSGNIVKENYKSLLKNDRLLEWSRSKGLENSEIVDVPGDGNCLFYSLLAPLLGYIPDKGLFTSCLQSFKHLISDYCEKCTKENETKNGERDSLKTKKKRWSKVRNEWFQDSGIVDGNGDKINKYLRRVPGNDYLLSCSICQNVTCSVKYKG